MLEEFCHLKILEKKNEFVRKTRNRMGERILKSFKKSGPRTQKGRWRFMHKDAHCGIYNSEKLAST